MFRAFSKTILIILTSLVFMFIIGYGSFQVAYQYTSTPEFCSSCHYIEPYVTSWSKSPHKKMSCMECHEPSGPLGKIHSKARGMNYYLSDITNDFSVPMIKAEYIDEQNCFGCHTGQNSSYRNAVSLKANNEHFRYIEDNQNCSSCHNEVGHKTNIGINKITTNSSE